MSAGAFQISRYERNGAVSIHGIDIQPETAAATFDGVVNDPPAAAVNSDFSVKISRAANACGLLPRKANVRFTGTLPTGYKADQVYPIVILQESVWAGITRGQVGTYLGEATVVVSKSNEDVK